ncbi:MAG: Hsp70 family protein [Alkalispirochaetaceae bacterium]
MTVGIDLGTTNSLIACHLDGTPAIIPNERGSRLTPSVVSVAESGEILVGESAKNQAVVHADRTVLAVKRSMGTQRTFSLGERSMSPEEVSAEVLRTLRRSAERYLGEEVREVVVTVPAHFTDGQRQATREAARLAGLQVRTLVNEPTAAALAYSEMGGAGKRVVVYDLGGGTFDVTCLERQEDEFYVRSTLGDNNLGGIDFDRLLGERMRDSFEEQSGLSLTRDPFMEQQLSELVERAKIELSSNPAASVVLPFMGSSGRPMHLRYDVRREEFEELISSLVERTISLTRRAIEEAGFDGVDALVLSGGSSRVPLVQRRLEEAFAVPSAPLVNPDEVVAIGAAIHARSLQAESGSRLHDVSSYALGVEIDGGTVIHLIRRNTPLPAHTSRVFTTITDMQELVEVHVVQGDSPRAKDNISLGRFTLSGIQRSKKGNPRIEVSFSVDEDGMTQVHARDLSTGSAERITIIPAVEGDDPAEEERRLASLIRRAEQLLEMGGSSLEREFAVEAAEILAGARRASVADDDERSEYRLALESLVRELNTYLQEVEEAGGSA